MCIELHAPSTVAMPISEVWCVCSSHRKPSGSNVSVKSIRITPKLRLQP
jgi:hypothetical protein